MTTFQLANQLNSYTEHRYSCQSRSYVSLLTGGRWQCTCGLAELQKAIGDAVLRSRM